MIRNYIKQMRPENWLKNIFVFIPIVFALALTDAVKFMSTIAAFVLFCLASSSVYILNDICDADIDRKNPKKSKRPIAAGEISAKRAFMLAIALSIAALGASFLFEYKVALIISIYIAVNILYSVRLKHLPVYDVFCISVGFILRVYAGSFASGEPVSDWLFLTLIAMALFMAFGKRRGEMLTVDIVDRREVLGHYSIGFLNGMMFVSAGMSIVFYALWSMSRGMYMIYTVPVIVFIVCKYLLLIHDEKSCGDPTTVILGSRSLIVSCIIYAVLTVVLLYAGTYNHLN